MLMKQRQMDETLKALPIVNTNTGKNILAVRVKPTLHVFRREIIVIPIKSSDKNILSEASKHLYRQLGEVSGECSQEDIRRLLGEAGILVGFDNLQIVEDLGVQGYMIYEPKITLQGAK